MVACDNKDKNNITNKDDSDTAAITKTMWTTANYNDCNTQTTVYILQVFHGNHFIDDWLIIFIIMYDVHVFNRFWFCWGTEGKV